jgi:hypothetical protein
MAKNMVCFSVSSGQIWKNKIFFLNDQIFSITFLAKTVKDAQTFLLSYPDYSQIWLNFLMDDHHFSYMTKTDQKTH